MRKKWRCLIRSESNEQYNIEHNPQQEDFFKAVFVDCVFDVSFLKLFLVEGIYYYFFFFAYLGISHFPTERIFHLE